MLRRFRKEEDGQDLVEYALLAAVVALATVAALGNLKAAINSVWTAISNNLAN